jgi:hypothetical protein
LNKTHKFSKQQIIGLDTNDAGLFLQTSMHFYLY